LQAPAQLTDATNMPSSDTPAVAVTRDGTMHVVWLTETQPRQLFHRSSRDGLRWDAPKKLLADDIVGTSSMMRAVVDDNATLWLAMVERSTLRVFRLVDGQSAEEIVAAQSNISAASFATLALTELPGDGIALAWLATPMQTGEDAGADAVPPLMYRAIAP
jgi:hypothetical protein